MKTSKLLILSLLLLFGACQSSKLISDEPKDDACLYEQSILSAMTPSVEKAYSNLISINGENKDLIRKNINGEEYILVATWKKDTTNYKTEKDSLFFNTKEWPIWVTTAPELLNRMKNESAENVEYRLKQLLGLPPTSDYKYFVEFWVKPGDLFRPCPDKEIDDNRCELCFPDKNDIAYISWIYDLRGRSYYGCELYDKYPWTQLGYTYDWSPKNKTHVGLSEFVIGKNKKIVIKRIYSTKDYLNSAVAQQ